MFYQNSEQTFIPYYLIFTWVKCHVNIMRFPKLGAWERSPSFSALQSFL